MSGSKSNVLTIGNILRINDLIVGDKYEGGTTYQGDNMNLEERGEVVFKNGAVYKG